MNPSIRVGLRLSRTRIETDGGDLGGVIESLDYIKELGTNIIWLSPIFDSPQNDMGYDVSNYEEVYYRFGSVSDVEELIKGCHMRGMRLLWI